MTAPRDRYAQCHGDCTTDCGACKGRGRPDAGESFLAHLAETSTNPVLLAAVADVQAERRTPVHDPGLDHLLEEVAAEVLRQDAAGGMSYTRDGEWLANRTYSVQRAAHAVRSMRAIDMAAGECAVGGDRRCTTHGRFYKECWPDWTPDQSVEPTVMPRTDRLAVAREAVARRLADGDGPTITKDQWNALSELTRQEWRDEADALLALPELRALIGGEQP